MSKAALINSTSIAKARQIDTITPPPGLSYVEESIARCSRLSRQHIPFLRSSPFGSFVNVSGNDLEVSVTKFAKENSITVEWSFVSILGELRMHSGCRQFDVEQFIESFNPDIVDISQNTPDYLLIHMRLKEEEEKLLTRLEEHTYLSSNIEISKSQNCKRGEPLSDSDIILCKLFFSPKLCALSAGSQFDPSISLINEKDDDD